MPYPGLGKFAGINDDQQEFDKELEDDTESQTAHSGECTSLLPFACHPP
jgi:hypothetical protein